VPTSDIEDAKPRNEKPPEGGFLIRSLTTAIRALFSGTWRCCSAWNTLPSQHVEPCYLQFAILCWQYLSHCFDLPLF
jgi:hypothetical protein